MPCRADPLHDVFFCHHVSCRGDKVSGVLYALSDSRDAVPGEQDHVSGVQDALPCDPDEMPLQQHGVSGLPDALSDR